MEPSMLIFFMIVVGIPVIGGISMGAFQRWLQHKEKMSQLIANETAEKAAQYAAHVERIEARCGFSRRSSQTAACKPPRRSRRFVSRRRAASPRVTGDNAA